ncbi:MAG TPA: hypothetical protein VI027_12290 [Rubrobacteraceae bacterium]|jgi:hypothetical protein
MNMTLVTFQELVGRVSGLGEDSDFVEAAVLREARERRGELLRERAQAVANDAIQRASGWKRVPAKALGGESRELGTSPDAAFVSKALGKRLEPWAEELREEGFGNPRAPFPEDPTAAAEWIEMQSKTDREQWQRRGVSTADALREIERLVGLTGLMVRIEPRLLEYIRPHVGYRQMVRVFPHTFLELLAQETDRVAKKTAFRPEVLTGFVLTGLQPMISRGRIRKTHGGCRIPGDIIPCQSVTLEFYTADVTYDEVRTLYAEIREYFGAADKEGLSWPEFDFISLVESMGGPPEEGKVRFWEEVQRRWKEMPVSRHSPLGSWRAARNKYARLDSRKNLREWTIPNLGMPIPEDFIA